jgi:hypothetical protein
MLALTRQIVRLRKDHPALRLGAIDVVTTDDALLVLDRRVPGQVLRCLFNLGQAPLPTGLGADWRVVFATGGADPVMLLLPATTAITPGTSPAGEPRDRLDWQDAPVTVLGLADHNLFGALLRAAQVAGALDAALALAVAHVNARVQFGKPLSRLQAVQQSLAVLAGEAAAWDELCAEHYGPVFRFVHQLGGGFSVEDAERDVRGTRITISLREANDQLVKLSISHALAQACAREREKRALASTSMTVLVFRGLGVLTLFERRSLRTSFHPQVSAAGPFFGWDWLRAELAFHKR